MKVDLLLRPVAFAFSWNCARNLSFSCPNFRKNIRVKPILTELELFNKFVDERKIVLKAGKGGDGRSAFLRDKHTAFGGPNGGDGGRGADILFKANHNVKGLKEKRPFYYAPDGKNGGCHDLFGKDGKNLIIEFPVGTLVRCEETDEIVADLCKDGQIELMCSGGEGGKGNRFFASSTYTTPLECTAGLPGEEMTVWVELRTLAHAGLIGFPNAGKSTLLRSLTRAKPAVADYEFTTLVPHIGVLHFEDFTQVVIADTPGIIEDAHNNAGLGIRFLKHIERCRFLLYVIDMSIPEPSYQLEHLLYELEKYNPNLVNRPGIILANKIDLPQSIANLQGFCDFAQNLDLPFEIMPISGQNCTYIEEVIIKIKEKYDIDIKERKKYGKTIALEW